MKALTSLAQQIGLFERETPETLETLEAVAPAGAPTRRGRKGNRGHQDNQDPGLKWGHWPEPETQLAIDGVEGVWSFFEPMPCGRELDAVLLVAYDQRNEARQVGNVIERRWVVVDRVHVLSPDVRR